MNDVMLPWPEPRRPGKDNGGKDKGGSGKGEPAPHYEIQRVNADGSTGPVEVLPITRPPWAAKSGRRGFLGAGIASSVAAALLLSGCGDDDSKSPSSPSPTDTDSGTPYPTGTDSYTPSPTESDTPTTDPPTDVPTYPTETSPTYPDPDPTYGTTGGMTTGSTTSGSTGGGGTVCTCNKVCTCIPVCQAHELLNPDPVVRRMAETVVIAMGARELPYLRWAASEASAPLRTRIEELIETVRGGRGPGPDDLADPGCAPYLTSGNPVIAMMAAQVLVLRALRGAGLSGVTAERAAEALTAGHALHLERAPAWSG
ncbi:hypothetical protein ACQEU8_16580 [Streptomyces sp. CA-250714]|uniref:hypothetical protein n=1 Tax=Streptomyces sp. CA-250714 TaxID=3240060 RepID=UPI003D8B72E6